MIVAAAALAIAYGVLRGPYRTIVIPSIAVAGIHPALGLAWGASHLAVVRSRRIGSIRAAARDERCEQLLAIDLVASGVEAGVAFTNAVETAIAHLHDPVAGDLARRLRFTNRRIPEHRDDGPIDAMFDAAEVSSVTGGALANDLRELHRTEIERDDTAVEERLQRLPVKMLFPLALLILPGFLLTTVVPAVVAGVSRLAP
ncbi:MAG: hypothetical protein R2823_08865 [Acidimicrobiia bacterium]